MTLDLGAVGRLVAQMADDLAAAVPVDAARLERARTVLLEWAPRVDELAKRIDGKGFSGLAAGLSQRPDERRQWPPLSAEYTVCASDGSLIEPDRHGAAYYYLLNVGTVLLRYGSEPKAMLASAAMLGYRPEDLYLSLGEREVPLEGGVLRVKRAVAETEALAKLLLESPTSAPVLGLQDGTLVLWLPEGAGKEAVLRGELLEPFLAALEGLRAARIPIASYISRPRSAEVVNALRPALCPFPVVDCRRNCPHRPAPCDEIDGVVDRRLIAALPLADGERSALFASRSRLMEQYGDHRIYFYYLNVGSEVARVEVPRWVADDCATLDLVHAVVYDQCRRGAGYPRALTEAHEKAVIGVGERQQCQRLIEIALARHHVPMAASEKQQSKRLRGV